MTLPASPTESVFAPVVILCEPRASVPPTVGLAPSARSFEAVRLLKALAVWTVCAPAPSKLTVDAPALKPATFQLPATLMLAAPLALKAVEVVTLLKLSVPVLTVIESAARLKGEAPVAPTLREPAAKVAAMDLSPLRLSCVVLARLTFWTPVAGNSAEAS